MFWAQLFKALLRVISLTVLADSVYNILIFQHICVPLDVNFNESLTNDIVSFEQLGPGIFLISPQKKYAEALVMSTITCFYGEIRIFLMPALIWSYDPDQI